MIASKAKETMLVVSTAHIKESTAQWLNKQVEQKSVNSEVILFPKGEYGWFIYVNLDENDNIENLNIPEDLSKLLTITAQEDCYWLCLDRDGFEIDSLPRYEW